MLLSPAAACSRPAAAATAAPLVTRRSRAPPPPSSAPRPPRKVSPFSGKQQRTRLCFPIAAAAASSSSSSPSPPSPPSKASLLVAQGRAKYAAGDRMGALALFESALKQAPTAPEAAAASWNATVVHCSFGDVELAQITLRDALAAGLDFERALTAEGRRVTGARVDEIRASVADNDASVAAREGSGPGGDGGGGGDPSAALRLPFAGSPQVASQLRKFAKNFARASSLAASATPSYSSSPSSSSPSSSSPISVDGIDASPAAIAKRVAVLLAVLLGLGVGLYLYGLQYLYPSTS